MTDTTYETRRSIWLDLIKSSGLQLKSFKHPQLGANKEELFIDIAILKKDSKKLLVHVTGTHGIEGYLGSLVQESIFKSSEVLNADVNLCFVHVLNPFGMSWRRRVNAGNIDLNRNGANFSGGPPKNSDYRELAEIIEADNWITRAASLPRLGRYLVQWGPSRVLGAVASGQYEYPGGLFFGGEATSWELSTLVNCLREEFPDQDEVCVLDVHTGLGNYGQEYLIADDNLRVEETHQLQKIFKTKLHLSAETGYPVSGSLGTALARAFPKAETFPVVQEFGTFDALSNLLCLIQENQLWQLGERNSPERQKLITKVFFPPDENWRRHCVDLGVRRCEQWIQKLNRPVQSKTDFEKIGGI